ncbi:MAG: UxaA family hydrolase [Deltaproteobacteria bacterium]|jgi:altronate dehydratase small subunit|nr:UxaA family hydrolase [Deltaproteobacteria bacterium]
MRIDAIMIKREDNVATALRDLHREEDAAVSAGEAREMIRLIEDIPFGHKFAVCPINQGDQIIKYGEVIGRATQSIDQGAHAHIQNIESLRGRGDLD